MKHFYLKGKKYSIKEGEDGKVTTEEIKPEADEIIPEDDITEPKPVEGEEPVVEDEEPVVEGEEKPKVDVEAQAKKIASRIAKDVRAELGLGGMKELNTKIDKFLNMNSTKKLAEIVNGKDIFSAKETLTKEETIVAFYHALVTNNEIAVKALSEGVSADGGYLFPTEFLGELVKVENDFAVVRPEVRVIKMKRNTMTMPTLTNRVKVYWTAENATKTTTTANFYTKVLTAYKAAAIIYASDELIEDSDLIDVVQEIISQFAEAIADEEDRVLTIGTGTAQPTGLITGTVNTTLTITHNIGFDDLIDLETSLNTAYLRNAKFMVHKQQIAELRKLKDTTNRYIWMDGVAGTTPPTIMGYPVIANNWLPKKQIMFGDFKKGYWLGDRQAMTVLMSQHVTQAFTKDETAIRVVFRIAGDIVQSAALSKLVMS